MSINPHFITGLQLAEVTDTEDPESRGRIQVRLNSNNLEVWAMVMVAGGGNDYGVSCLPKTGELVVLAFLDKEQPVVMGALWKVNDEHPQDAQPAEDNYLIRTPRGSQLRMNDETPEIEIKTGSGYRVLIDDAAGEIKIECGSQNIMLNPSAVEISASSSISLDAATIILKAGNVNIQSGMTKATGTVQCSTLIANTVMGTTYTPGAGNIW